MNLIKQQAEDFFNLKYFENDDYKDFIKEIRSELFEYRKISHRLEFIEHMIIQVKLEYEKHYLTCPHKNDKKKCGMDIEFENILFFIQNEKEDLLEKLPQIDFNQKEKTEINESLQNIISDLEYLKLGQQITYDELLKEVTDLKDYYFLNKTRWSQLMIGKLTEMVASGIISETLSKEIVVIVSKHYSSVVASL